MKLYKLKHQFDYYPLLITGSFILLFVKKVEVIVGFVSKVNKVISRLTYQSIFFFNIETPDPKKIIIFSWKRKYLRIFIKWPVLVNIFKT